MLVVVIFFLRLQRFLSVFELSASIDPEVICCGRMLNCVNESLIQSVAHNSLVYCNLTARFVFVRASCVINCSNLFLLVSYGFLRTDLFGC